MPIEPAKKRVVAFIDGQNLFYGAKKAFGYSYPNYDIKKLCEGVASFHSAWNIEQIRFYTGVPDGNREPEALQFWNAKLASMGRLKIHTYKRVLKYRTEDILLPDGTTHSFPIRQEKGIDVRLALDIVRLALDKVYDVGLIFSQDQDLSEVADEIKTISSAQNRWISLTSAFPLSNFSTNKRGINRTSWFTIDQALYDSCIDHTDYRPKKSRASVP
jgi:uncharacterized LabA/DUF88 family protein